MSEVEELKIALRGAILNKKRTIVTCLRYDPEGSIYSIEWTDTVKNWAKLCGLDLDKDNPPTHYA